MVTMPASAKSSLRSFDRTSRVSISIRSSRSRVPWKSVPRGTAIVSGGVTAATGGHSLPTANRQPPTSPQPLLRRLREMHALDIQRDAAGRHWPPEAADQLVVAAAAAEREAHGRVVELEHGSGVVAELAHEPEIEDDAIGDAALGEQLVQGPEALHRFGDRPVGALEHLGAAAKLRQANQQLALGVRQAQLANPHLEPREIAAGEGLEERQVAILRDVERGEQVAVQPAVTHAETMTPQPRPLQGRNAQ